MLTKRSVFRQGHPRYGWVHACRANITKTDVDQRFLAIIFVENACTVRYAALWKELSNSVAMKSDQYPKTLSEATYLLTHWKAPAAQSTRAPGNQNNNGQSQLSFMQQRTSEPLTCQEITDNKNEDGTVKGSDGITHAHVTCHNCKWKGHYAPKCPAARQSTYHYGFTQFDHFIFNQEGHHWGLPVTVIILDTGSTFNSFFNRQLLGNMQTCDEIRAYSNGGHMDYFEDGVVSILPALSAYHNHDSLANIISLSEVAQYYRVVMDTEQSNSITVALPQSATDQHRRTIASQRQI